MLLAAPSLRSRDLPETAAVGRSEDVAAVRAQLHVVRGRRRKPGAEAVPGASVRARRVEDADVACDHEMTARREDEVVAGRVRKIAADVRPAGAPVRGFEDMALARGERPRPPSREPAENDVSVVGMVLLHDQALDEPAREAGGQAQLVN